jgi:hypothetical protein
MDQRPRGKVLIVDDYRLLREGLVDSLLASATDLQLIQAGNVAQGYL